MRKELDLGEKNPRSIKKDKQDRGFWMATWWYINNLQLLKNWNLHLSMRTSSGIHELLNFSSSFFTRALINEWIIISSNTFNPLSHSGDQHQFSPNNINTLSRDKIMRINKMISKEKLPWSFSKLSQLILKGNV